MSIDHTGKKDEVLDGWQLKRRVDRKKEFSFGFEKFTLSTGGKKNMVKVRDLFLYALIRLI